MERDEGLANSTRLQRTGLIESLLPENGEKPFAMLTRKVIQAEMNGARDLLSALRGMIRWMIDEGHLDEDDDPTIGLKSGKAKASRESGGVLPWTEEDMALYRAKWPLGTEARLMFDILHHTFLRVGDAHRFGPQHLRQMAVQIATEKSRGKTNLRKYGRIDSAVRATTIWYTRYTRWVFSSNDRAFLSRSPMSSSRGYATGNWWLVPSCHQNVSSWWSLGWAGRRSAKRCFICSGRDSSISGQVREHGSQPRTLRPS
jgi:hypothetical protein